MSGIAPGGASLAAYYPVFLYFAVVAAFAVMNLVMAHAIGPRKRTPVKDMPYESGMDPVGEARQRYDVRYYLIAILFLIFDVELLFLYPWAVAYYAEPSGIPAALHSAVFWEVLIFLGTLVLAYIYAWRRGVFRWR